MSQNIRIIRTHSLSEFSLLSYHAFFFCLFKDVPLLLYTEAASFDLLCTGIIWVPKVGLWKSTLTRLWLSPLSSSIIASTLQLSVIVFLPSHPLLFINPSHLLWNKQSFVLFQMLIINWTSNWKFLLYFMAFLLFYPQYVSMNNTLR